MKSVVLIFVLCLCALFGLSPDGQTQNLFVPNYNNGTIRKYTASGTDLGNFATNLNEPIAVAFDQNKNLYVTERGNKTMGSDNHPNENVR